MSKAKDSSSMINKQGKSEMICKCAALDRENINEPFSLTDVQMAYLMGRDDKFELGGVSCHYYIEIESKLEIERLNVALQKLIKRHPMLQAIILPNGEQRILKDLPEYKIETVDISYLDKADKQDMILKERERMSHHVFKTDQWPLFEFKAYQLNNDTCYLFIGIDILIADAFSIQVITKELMDIYYDRDALLPDIEITFRDFMLAYSELKESDIYKKDKEFWLNKVDSFPQAPMLPLAKDFSTIEKPRFRRVSGKIDKAYWKQLKEKCKEENIRPSVVFCTAYAEVLGFWSNQSNFAVNFTVSNRYPVHKDVDKIIGDFTSVMLIEVDLKSKLSFWERAREIQNTLTEALEHKHYDGIEFIREISKHNNMGNKSVMPIVFTSLMFGDHQDGWSQLGDIKYNITQTSQLYLDNQVTKSLDGINVRWDFVDQLFDEEVISCMFEQYINILTSVLDENKGYTIELGNSDKTLYSRYNSTNEDIKPSTLDGLFKEQVLKTPQKTAVTFEDNSISFEELDKMSDCVARYLKQMGVTKGDKVGILAAREVNTIVNIMGVLKSAAAYVPINPEHPLERRNYMLKNSNCKLLLGPDTYETLNLGQYDSGDLNIKSEPEDTAYVIYTSGSTGRPKGVIITHGAAANTIVDINRKFNVNEKDRIIGVSSMCFDLSVYDIFGALSTGATLVMVEDQRNVMDLIDVLLKQRITIWNSVPAIMDMVTENLDKNYINKMLRLVMLSGDWIPLKLPEKINHFFENTKVISLGGATEASIWSIYYPIDEMKAEWKSFPYGRPLANQTFFVLNYDMKPCPVGVSGELYIGGVGIAKGYINDEEKTRSAFINHHDYGYIYRTGDYGVMKKEGYIEFLGRRDHQIKIRGHRIELGEIESTLRDFPGVRDAAVTLVERHNVKQIAAYVVPAQSNQVQQEINEDEIVVSDEFWGLISKDAVAFSRNIPDDICTEKYAEFNNKLEQISTIYICNSLKTMGVCTTLGEHWSVDKIINTCNIVPKYRKLMGQWMDILEEDGYVKKINKDVYECIRIINETSVESLWEELRTFNISEGWKNPLRYLEAFGNNIIRILSGELNSLNLLFPDGSWDMAESIYQFNSMAKYFNNIATSVIRSAVKHWPKDKKIRILEFGAGTGGTTASLLPELPADRTLYTYTDISTFFTDRAKAKFSDYPFVEYSAYDIDKNPLEQGFSPHGYDIIFGANVLHDARVLRKTLEYFKSLLTPNGFLMALEITKNTRLHKISIGFIDGFSNYEDEREMINLPLLSVEEWKNLTLDKEFNKFVSIPEPGFATEVFDHHIIVARGPSSTKWVKTDDIKTFLHKSLPDYMIPNYFINLEGLPLTPNGKIDKKALPEPEEKLEIDTQYVAPRNELEKLFVTLWQESLGIEKIGIHDNFFVLGGDSLKAIQISAKAIQNDINISIADIYNHLTISKLVEDIQNKRSETGEGSNESTKVMESSPENEAVSFSINKDRKSQGKALFEPFTLTDVQLAYLVGRSPNIELGGVSTHYYMEIETELDMKRLSICLQKLIERHPMLRAIVLPDGKQKILEKVDRYWIDEMDISHLGEEEKNLYITRERERMSHHIFKTDQWPLFEFKAIKISEDIKYLCLSFDILITDGSSIYIIGKELKELYDNPELKLPELNFTFKDYIEAYEEFKNSEFYHKERAYWLNKLSDFPQAPALTLKKDPKDVSIPHRFRRCEKVINKNDWIRIKQKAFEKNLTPAALMCTAYVEVLAFWSNQKRFAIDLTVFNRYPFHKDVEKIVGDFTSIILLDINLKSGSFWDHAKLVQESLSEALEHRHYDGVEFIREISRYHNMGTRAVMPVIFTCVLFDDTRDGWTDIGRIRTGISQTPQVYLDNQILDMNGQLRISWDYVEELFDDDIVNTMFGQYIGILEGLLEPDQEIKLLPSEGDRKIIEEYNQTEEDIVPTTLCDLFEQQVKLRPKHIAVEGNGEKITFEELDKKSSAVAFYLNQQGIVRGDRVGILATREIGTIINIMGILKAGAAYIPINPEHPIARREYMLKDSQCKLLLEPELYLRSSVSECGSENIETLAEAEDIAYIIYTSGSTGKPKGVIITHDAVTNTIIDINRKFNVNEEDRIIGVSSMCFDLSVYDIFGALSTGATLVMVPDQRDIINLLEVVTKERITIWNTVPAIMDMMINIIEDSYINDDLRLVMLSGDWIPLYLPEKSKYHFKNSEVISLGGATEASIWSIYFPINEIESQWKSIPYGMPLANQKFYVLNGDLEPCPIGVSGELYIGGVGVAKGYINNAEKTMNAFIKHHDLGYIYKTGDYGVMHRDGYIEFQGRKDQQVKVRGHRIELGEIESTLLKHESVSNAVVIDFTKDNGSKALCAYVVPVGNFCTSEIREFLHKELPDYMIPGYFVEIEKIPLTSNRKVDRKSLPKPEMVSKVKTKYVAPRNYIEEKLVEAWTEVLGVEGLGINDDFFEAGGDSIKAIQISAYLQRHGLKLGVSEQFTYHHISTLSERVESINFKAEQGIICGNIPLTPIQKWFFENGLDGKKHWNQAFILTKSDGFDENLVRSSIKKILEHHDALRMVYKIEEGNFNQFNRGIDGKLFGMKVFDLTMIEDFESKMEVEIYQLQKSMDLHNGPLVNIGLFKTNDGDHLLLSIHHLVVDGVSWRIILEDFAMGYSQASRGEEIVLQDKTSSFKDWAEHLVEYSESRELLLEKDYWKNIYHKVEGLKPIKDHNYSNKVSDSKTFTVKLSNELTDMLLKKANKAYNTEVNDILLAALGMTMNYCKGMDKIAINVEGHGREEIINEVDITRTIGWFTSIYPVVLEIDNRLDISSNLKTVKENLRHIPNKGVGYGILKYLTSTESKQNLAFDIQPDISFNYLGQFEKNIQTGSFTIAPVLTGSSVSPNIERMQTLDIVAMVTDGYMTIDFIYNKYKYKREEITMMANGYKEKLSEIIEHCVTRDDIEFTPSDFEYKQISIEELDEIANIINQ